MTGIDTKFWVWGTKGDRFSSILGTAKTGKLCGITAALVRAGQPLLVSSLALPGQTQGTIAPGFFVKSRS